MPTPFDDLKKQFDSARKDGGGIVECDPTYVYDFSENKSNPSPLDRSIVIPSNTRVRGNGSIWNYGSIPAKAGTVSFLRSESSVDIEVEGVGARGVAVFTKTDKTGPYLLDVAGGSHVRLLGASASNMMGLIRCRNADGIPIDDVVIRDGRAENCYYGVAFSTTVKNAVIDNLYCKNVIRAAVVIGGQNVRLQYTDEHDGKFDRFETTGLFKTQSTDKLPYETDGIVVDATAIGTVGLRSVVRVEIQGPPNAKPSHIYGVDMTCRVIGDQRCALVAFASLVDGANGTVELKGIGWHSVRGLVVHGHCQQGQKVSDPLNLWKPYFTSNVAFG